MQTAQVDSTGLHRPIRYRPDIDGLRAIAIMSVVAFHTGMPWVGGGFIGVDVFFVISGYLIGSLVYKEIRGRSFSIANFYARRARRILPALCGVLVFWYIAASLLLSPVEMQNFGLIALAAMLSISNIYFSLHTGGYFAANTDLKPMLMTWSLGVEEQFYVLFPLLMLLLRKTSWRLQFCAIGAVALASLATSIWATPIYQQSMFFLLPTRAWELAAGVLLAIWETRRDRETAIPAPAMNAMSIAGLGMIALAIVAFNRKTPFPGYAAIAPVAGAVLIIAARRGVVNRALSRRPIVFVGLISYSWYLWHWPFLSFARICSGTDIPIRAAVLISLLSFGCAVASYRWIEQPFRKSKTPTMTLLRRYTGLAAIAILPAAVIYLAHGLPQRNRKVAQMERDALHFTGDSCQAALTVEHPRLTPQCVPPGKQSAVALIGDSHAAAISEALRSLSNQAGYRFVELTKLGCPALEGVSVRSEDAARARSCSEFNRERIDFILHDASVRIVVVVGNWSLPFRMEDEGFSFAADGQSAPGTDTERWELLRTGLTGLIARLEGGGKTVYLAQDSPSFDFDPVGHMRTRMIAPRRWVAGLIASSSLQYGNGVAPDSWLPADRRARQMVGEVAAKHPEVRLIDMRAPLCSSDGCRFAMGDKVLYSDVAHLSTFGATIALSGLHLPESQPPAPR